MGEWESIFGEGVSAESVISGLQSDCFDDDEQSVSWLKAHRRVNPLAFRCSDSLKQEMIARLESAILSGLMVGCKASLVHLIQGSPVSLPELSEEFGIPLSLVYLVESVFQVIRDGYQDRRAQTKQGQLASDWLLNCLDAIDPGSDLNLVAPQLAARAAYESQRELRGKRNLYSGKGTEEMCEPALMVAYARARGVILPTTYTDQALSILRKVLSEAEQEMTYCTKEDLAFAVVEGAADPLPEGAGRAIEFAAIARLRIGGDASEEDNMWEYAKDLLALLRNAPKRRKRLIDVNKPFPQLPP